MEKSKIDVTEFHKKNEEFFLLAWIALFLLAMEIILRNTYFRNTP
jgi:Ca-activated chloride channel family protein